MPTSNALKIIVLTDLHIVPEGETILGIDPAARLKAALRHIQQHHGDAHRVIITGDLTHYGDVASYQRLRRCLADISLPYLLLLGNHDDRTNFRSVFPEVPVDPNGYVQTTVDTGAWQLVTLDTLSAPTDGTMPEDDGSGRLCEQRLRWLDATLKAARDRHVLLFLHHPPHAVGFRGMDRIRLADEDALHAIVQRHGNVRHMFAGHIHRTINGTARGIPFSIFKSPVHQQPMTLASDDTSLSVLEPAAYGIVLATANAILVHTDDFQLDVPEA